VRSRTRRRLTWTISLAIIAALGYSCATRPATHQAAPTSYPPPARAVTADDMKACDQPPIRRFLAGVDKHAHRAAFAPGRDAPAWRTGLDKAGNAAGWYLRPHLHAASTQLLAYERADTATWRAYHARRVHAAALGLLEACVLEEEYRFDNPRKARPSRKSEPAESGRSADSDSSSSDESDSRGLGGWRPGSWGNGW